MSIILHRHRLVMLQMDSMFVRIDLHANDVVFQTRLRNNILLLLQRNARRIGVADMHAIMVESVYRPIKGRYVCVH